MTNRVHIDAPAGIIDIEGEKEFVEGLLAKLFPLIEEVGFGSHPQDRSGGGGQDNSKEDDGDESVDDTDKPKAKRRKATNPPKGHSCGDRILALKADGFFKEHRGGVDIVAGLKARGWTHKSNQVGAAAGQLFDRGELQRTKDGNGPWKYFWDRA